MNGMCRLDLECNGSAYSQQQTYLQHGDPVMCLCEPHGRLLQLFNMCMVIFMVSDGVRTHCDDVTPGLHHPQLPHTRLTGTHNLKRIGHSRTADKALTQTYIHYKIGFATEHVN